MTSSGAMPVLCERLREMVLEFLITVFAALTVFRAVVLAGH
jgi:hypothetical protein